MGHQSIWGEKKKKTGRARHSGRADIFPWNIKRKARRTIPGTEKTARHTPIWEPQTESYH